MMDQLYADIGYSFRSLKRTPGFTLTAALMLAVSINLNATVLSFADALLFFAPVGVTDPARLVRVPNSWMQYDQYITIGQNLRSMSVAAQSGLTPVSIGSGVSAELVEARYVTANYFSMLGVLPLWGRTILANEDVGTPNSVVLGHRFWRNQFNGDSKVVGTVMRISGQVYTIVGVAPEGFTGVDAQNVDVWLPPAANVPGGLWLIGRLKDGVSFDQARAELLVRYPGDIPIFTDQPRRRAQVKLIPIYEDLGTRLSKLNRLVLCLLGAGVVLLSIACANVSGLLLNRAFHQKRDVAVRMQLGARRSRIIRQLLTEVLLLNTIAAVAALLSVDWTTRLLERVLLAPLPGKRILSMFPDLLYNLEVQRLGGTSLNVRVLVATVFVALIATSLSALAPAIYVGKSSLNEWLKTQRGMDPSQSRLRRWSVVVQVALSIILLVNAGLFVRSLYQAVSVNFGIDTDNILIISVDLRRSGYTVADNARAFTEMLNRVRRLPQVTSASLSSSPPIGFVGLSYVSYDIPGYQDPYGVGRSAGGRGPFVEAVSPEYFKLLRMTILRGRFFTDSDDASTEPVVIINETLVRDIFQGEDPLGRCVQFYREQKCRRIVGVVSSGRREIVRLSNIDVGQYDPGFYVPVDQRPDARHLLIRTATDPVPLMSNIRAELQSVAPNAPYIKLEPLFLYLDQQTHGWRAGSILFGTFALMALVLGAAGTYSLLAFTLKQRTVEIGIRLALGARPRDIVGMSLWSGMIPVLIGIGIGVACAAALSRALESLVFGISSTDVLTISATALLMVVIGSLACSFPAATAAVIDPAKSLRHE